MPIGRSLRYNRVILQDVKTAVSIPDTLFEAADDLARRLGISRSELYARALARELAAESDALVTSRLDEVYADVDSSLDAPVSTAQRRVLESSEW
jgi:hypothetical protein